MRSRARLVRTALALATLAAAAAAASVTVLDADTLTGAIDSAAVEVTAEVPEMAPLPFQAANDLEMTRLLDSAHLRRLVGLTLTSREQVPGPRGWVLAHPRTAATYAGTAAAALVALTLAVWPTAWRRTARAVALWALAIGAVPWAVVAATGAYLRGSEDTGGRATAVLVRELAVPAVPGGRTLLIAGLVALVVLAVPWHLARRAPRSGAAPWPDDPEPSAVTTPVRIADPVPVGPVRANEFDPRAFG